MKEKRIQFGKTEWIDKNLELRESAMLKQTDVVRRDLTRYYYLMFYTAAEIKLTEAEFYCICDALNGSISTDDALMSARMLPVQIEEHINFNQMPKQFDIDGDQLIEKVKNMTAAQKQCIIDVVERYWELNDKEIEYKSYFEFFKFLQNKTSEE